MFEYQNKYDQIAKAISFLSEALDKEDLTIQCIVLDKRFGPTGIMTRNGLVKISSNEDFNSMYFKKIKESIGKIDLLN